MAAVSIIFFLIHRFANRFKIVEDNLQLSGYVLFESGNVVTQLVVSISEGIALVFKYIYLFVVVLEFNQFADVLTIGVFLSFNVLQQSFDHIHNRRLRVIRSVLSAK